MDRLRKQHKEFIAMIQRMINEYLTEIYKYNDRIRDTGYYLKPVHIVVKKTGDKKAKYYYYGRYWYRIEYRGKRKSTSMIKWVYLGKEKPDPSLPDPPDNPIVGLVLRVDDEGVTVNLSYDELFSRIAGGGQGSSPSHGASQVSRRRGG